LQGVTQRAGALAGIGQEAEQSIEQVIGLVDALSKVTAAATTGNVFGAIFAGLGTLGAAFGGQDREAEELKRLQAENTSALQEATAAYRAGGDRSVPRARWARRRALTGRARVDHPGRSLRR
jgi:hypothetical protein